MSNQSKGKVFSGFPKPWVAQETRSVQQRARNTSTEMKTFPLNFLYRQLPENVLLVAFLVEIKVTGILQTCFYETNLSEKH
jgi:hypothetical protein